MDKEGIKAQIIEHLSNPENQWSTKSDLSVNVLGKSANYVSRTFTPEEWADEIQAPALQYRRTAYAGTLVEIDQVLLDQARAGDVGAIKLCYQKFENWSPAKPEKPRSAGDNAFRRSLNESLNFAI